MDVLLKFFCVYKPNISNSHVLLKAISSWVPIAQRRNFCLLQVGLSRTVHFLCGPSPHLEQHDCPWCFTWRDIPVLLPAEARNPGTHSLTFCPAMCLSHMQGEGRMQQASDGASAGVALSMCLSHKHTYCAHREEGGQNMTLFPLFHSLD